jgi:hypothetical protein
MDRPTRQEQAEAILGLKALRLASKVLGRRVNSAGDYEAAFNLEWIDLIAEIPGPDALLSLGRNIVGPKDGLYILREGDTFRVYLQERGESRFEVTGADFETARDAAVHRLIQLQGMPYTPPGN